MNSSYYDLVVSMPALKCRSSYDVNSYNIYIQNIYFQFTVSLI